MTANQHTRRPGKVWRAVRRAAAPLLAVHVEQARVWKIWWHANRGYAPDSGPLTWVLTLDGYRLAGGHLPAPDDSKTGGRP